MYVWPSSADAARVRCRREESGCCYALDIGGTNFRVVYYKLSDKHGTVVRSSTTHCWLLKPCRTAVKAASWQDLPACLWPLPHTSMQQWSSTCLLLLLLLLPPVIVNDSCRRSRC